LVHHVQSHSSERHDGVHTCLSAEDLGGLDALEYGKHHAQLDTGMSLALWELEKNNVTRPWASQKSVYKIEAQGWQLQKPSLLDNGRKEDKCQNHPRPS